MSENSAPLFLGISVTVSIHLVTPTAVLKLTSFHGRACPEFWDQINTSFHGYLCPKNWNSFSLFPLTKRVLLPTLRLQPVLWFLSSSSTCYAIHSGYYNDLYIPFSVQPTWGYRMQIAWPLFPTWIRYFVQQAGWGVDLHSYSSFNGQSLRPVNSNTEG